jgi:hypothetical protein
LQSQRTVKKPANQRKLPNTVARGNNAAAYIAMTFEKQKGVMRGKDDCLVN